MTNYTRESLTRLQSALMFLERIRDEGVTIHKAEAEIGIGVHVTFTFSEQDEEFVVGIE